MVRKKIIVVDDDALLCQTIDMCLTRKGHEVRCFSTGVDAVKRLFRERPDLIVLDIGLPDCDGWFLAKLLARLEEAEGIPVILMSVLDPDREKLSQAKPYAYIQKPFDMGQLVGAIESGLSETRDVPRLCAEAPLLNC